MGTKNNPGPYDCYAKAEPDEPIFVLLARDPLAPDIVREWAERKFSKLSIEDVKKANEARRIADAMVVWRLKHRPEKKP